MRISVCLFALASLTSLASLASADDRVGTSPDWAARAMNRGVRLGGSYYKIVARYRVRRESGVWNGELVTTPARVLGLDQMRKDVCPTNPGWDKF